MSGENELTIPEKVGDGFIALLRESGATEILVLMNVAGATPAGWAVKQIYYLIFDQTIAKIIKDGEVLVDYAIIKKQVNAQIDAVNSATTLSEAVNAFDNLT